MNRYIGWLMAVITLLLVGCASTPRPHNCENVCAIFKQYPKWYKAAKKTEAKWGVPISVQMAIMYYESSFDAEARPPKKYILGFIPNGRISTAYGYAQALDGTWNDYLASAGGFFSRRNKFESATDFIGWYSAQARERLGIASQDAFDLYLAYHEGLNGYARKSYLRKPWLIHLAQKVQLKTKMFESQLYALNPHHPLQPIFHEDVVPNDMQLETPRYLAADEIDSSPYDVGAPGPSASGEADMVNQ